MMFGNFIAYSVDIELFWPTCGWNREYRTEQRINCPVVVGWGLFWTCIGPLSPSDRRCATLVRRFDPIRFQNRLILDVSEQRKENALEWTF